MPTESCAYQARAPAWRRQRLHPPGPAVGCSHRHSRMLRGRCGVDRDSERGRRRPSGCEVTTPACRQSFHTHRNRREGMPLTGLKVVEACSNISGPLVGTILGDLGAHVVKDPKTGPRRRRSRLVASGLERHQCAVPRNQSEQDFARPRSSRRDRRPAIEGARRGRGRLRSQYASRRGGRPRLVECGGHGVNPRLVYCAIGAFGSKGPWKTRSAYDGLAQALSSQMAGNGLPLRTDPRIRCARRQGRRHVGDHRHPVCAASASIDRSRRRSGDLSSRSRFILAR